MKKQLTGVLATLLCLGCFTGCSMDSVTGTFGSIKDKATGIFDPILDKLGLKDKVETDVQGAAGYLYDLYVEKDTAVRADYEVPNTFQYMGYTYTVAWSVDVTSGVVLEKGDTVTKVNVDELLTADLTYVLTATLSDEYGNSAKTDLERVVKAASAMVSAPITSAPVAGTAYKYHVYQSTKQLDLYFAGSMDGFYFKTTEDVEAATDIYVEYKADSTTEFYPYFTDETGVKQYIGVKVSADGAHDNIVYAADPVSVFVWNAELGTITTTIIDKNDANTEFYLGNYNNYTTISASAISNASSAGSNVGHLIGLVDRNSVPAADKLKQTEKEIQVSADYIGSATVELPAMGTTYPDVAITYTVSGEGATLEGNVLTLTAGSAQSTVTLTATLKVGEESKEVVKTFTVTPKAVMPADGSTLTIKEILALTVQGDTTEKYYVEGTVKSVVNTTFGNVYIEDAEGNELYVYGLYSEDGSIKYGDMDSKPGVGSTVKLYSILATYNGKVQLKNACIKEFTAAPEIPDTPDTPADPDLKLQSAAKLTAGDLGVESEKYASEEGSATVDGIGYGFIQIGNYPDGLIRFRTKNGVSGSLWNTTAYASSIRKIVLTHNPEKSTYDGNKYTVSFGKTAECNDKTVEVETSASSGTLTIEVETGYTFFKITHANTYTQYWNSVEVFVEEDTTTKYALTTVNGNFMTGEVNSSEVVPGTALELPTLTATGKNFKGWFYFTYDENGNEVQNAAPAVMPEEDLTLFAVWEIIPYNVTFKYNDGTVYKTYKIGAEDVYSENEADVIIAASGMAWTLSMEMEDFPAGYVLKETLPETFELKEYTFTLLKKVTMSVINGNPRLDPNAVTTSEVVEGSELNLATLTAEGKEFLGWIDVEGNAAPAVAPAEDFAVYANWKVTPYTLTIKQEGAEDVVVTFGIEYAIGIDATVADLAYVLEDNLPENYVYAETVPETFELQNYTFTLLKKVIMSVINGNPRLDPNAVTTSEVIEGSKLNLATLTAEGKEFLGWIDVEGNAAPTVAPAEDFAVYANWKVIPYTLTIKQEGAEDVVVTFGVEYVVGIDATVADLAYVLEDNLPENYVYAETLPETFKLQNYTFTVVSTVTYYNLTLINGNQRLDPSAATTSQVAAGAALNLATLTAEGKEFLGWIDVEGNAAPDIMPEEDFALYASWKVVPYTLTIKQTGAEDKVVTFGIEYDNQNGIDISVNDLATVLEENLPEGYVYAETLPETFELQNYTFTLLKKVIMTVINGNPRLDPNAVTTSEVIEGSAIELTALEATGKVFLGWTDVEGNAAPTVAPAEDFAVYANWEVTPYTLTIKQTGAEDKVVTFGVEYVVGIDAIVTDLAFVLEDNLLEGYVYAETVPETFELQNYTFTLLKKVTMSVINGNPRLDPNAVTTSEVIEGSAIELATLTAEGKEFLGWIDVEGNAAPTVVPAEDFAVYANWKVIPYTLTIKQLGAEDVVVTFGVEYVVGIDVTVADLAFVLEDNLPANTDTATYSWVEAIPETFELKNYTFTINAVYTVNVEQALELVDGAQVIISGTVCSIDTVYSEQYNNITVTITDTTGKKLSLYRLKGNVALGDIITVTGKMATYNGNRQTAAGATAEITGHDNSYDYNEMTIAEAIAAVDGTNVIVTGTVAKIGTAYSEQYGNISVYIADDEGTQLYIYRLTGNVTVGQIIKIKGSMATHNGTRQVTGGTFEAVGTHTCTNYKDATCSAPTTCVVCGATTGEANPEAHSYVEHVCEYCNAVEPGYEDSALTYTYTYAFANYEIGTQYAIDEEHVLDENTTVTTTEAHFTSELRLYSSSAHDGFAIIKSAKTITSFAMNAGNKADTLNVYGSTDGTTWTLIEGVATSSSYTDYTVEMPEGTAYTYLKLDVAGTQQVRVKTITLVVNG